MQRSAPSSSGLALLPASVAVWGPFVFVHSDAGAPPLERTLGALPAVLARCGVDLERVAFRRREPWTLQANWKVSVWLPDGPGRTVGTDG